MSKLSNLCHYQRIRVTVGVLRGRLVTLFARQRDIGAPRGYQSKHEARFPEKRLTWHDTSECKSINMNLASHVVKEVVTQLQRLTQADMSGSVSNVDSPKLSGPGPARRLITFLGPLMF